MFGEIKALRLPKKFNSDEHKGFCFVDFSTKEHAKRAFDALSGSVHLYGRRLVLEWAEDDGVEEMRKRTAAHFVETRGPSSKKAKADFVVDDIKNDEDD